MIDDDVLYAARALARQRGATVGAVVSDMVRRGLLSTTAATERNVIRLLRDNLGYAYLGDWTDRPGNRNAQGQLRPPKRTNRTRHDARSRHREHDAGRHGTVQAVRR